MLLLEMPCKFTHAVDIMGGASLTRSYSQASDINPDDLSKGITAALVLHPIGVFHSLVIYHIESTPVAHIGVSIQHVA